MKSIVVVLGTRPEAIKMAPVILELKRKANLVDCKVVLTAQHRELLDGVLNYFKIIPDVDLNLMVSKQRPADLMSKALTGLTDVYSDLKPDLVLVHGDTATTFIGALSAFLLHIPVGHVEAGLRTSSIYLPFPEELNRRLTDQCCELFFPPTQRARLNLINENKSEEHMIITGNTEIDAQKYVLTGTNEIIDPIAKEYYNFKGYKLLLTSHRREHWGEVQISMFKAIREWLEECPDQVKLYFPVHPNPVVEETAQAAFKDSNRVLLGSAVEFPDLVKCLSVSNLVLTDSGGLQEQVCGLNKYCLVLREETERPEAVEAGFARVVGVKPENIRKALNECWNKVLSGELPLQTSINPFGEGNASELIVNECLRFLKI